jgi:hypothetical protein
MMHKQIAVYATGEAQTEFQRRLNFLIYGLLPAADTVSFHDNLNVVRACFPSLAIRTDSEIVFSPEEAELIRSYVTHLMQAVSLLPQIGPRYLTSRLMTLFNAIEVIAADRPWSTWQGYLHLFFLPVEELARSDGKRRFRFGQCVYRFQNHSVRGLPQLGKGANARVRTVDITAVNGDSGPVDYAAVKKVSPENWADWSNVLQEIKIVDQLWHACVPGILPFRATFLYTSKKHGLAAALIMPDGGETAYAIRDRLAPIVTWIILKQTADTLAAAHQRGIGHGDVKSANVVINRETETASLIDYGLARGVGDDRKALLLCRDQAGGTYYDSQCVPFFLDRSSPSPNVLALDVFAWGVMAFQSFPGIFRNLHGQDYPPRGDHPTPEQKQVALDRFLADARHQIDVNKRNPDPFRRHLATLLKGCFADLPDRWTMAQVVRFLKEDDPLKRVVLR